MEERFLLCGLVAPKLKIADVSATQIALTWRRVAGAAEYLLDERINGRCVLIATMDKHATGCTISNLTPSTTYSFRVGASRGTCTAWAHGKSATTAHLSPPAAPSFTAFAISTTQIGLAWGLVADATSYLVDEWISNSWVQIGTMSGSSTGSTLSGLVPNTTYYFDVGASNAAGTAWGPQQAATTYQSWVVDHPTAAYPYSPVSGPLFGSDGPSYSDVEQGHLGDCWLLCSLADAAVRDPSAIVNMFTYDGSTLENGSVVALWAVRFFNPDGEPEQVVVDTELPAGGEYYAGLANGVLWVALAEKAYAQANGQGIVRTPGGPDDSYGALNAGLPIYALQAITGEPATQDAINPATIPAAWNAGDLVVMGSDPNPPSQYIVGSHCYAIIGYDPSSTMPFLVYNPWGSDNGWVWDGTTYVLGLFWADASFLSQNYQVQSFGAV